MGERHEGDGEKARYGLLGEWILRLLAVAIVTIVIWLARRAGASWPFAAAYGAIVAVGISLASRGAPTAEKLADAGRALVISILLALVASSIAHSDAKRTSQTALALTLSSGHSFAGIDLHDRDLARFFIGGKNLTDAILSGADLHGAVLRHSTLANADLHGSHTNLTNADLSFANLRGADLRSVRLERANLVEADLRGARLAGADLRDAILSGADARGADFRDADLRGAQLLGTDLMGAFLEADVGGAVFSGDLRDANLEGAAIARLHGEPEPVWPKGFVLADAIAAASAPPKKPVPIPVGAVTDTVARVVDGDTIVLRGLPKVRLLGINAPQEERPSECYAAQATDDVRRLLPAGTPVAYILGATGRDKFDRSLAYLWLKSGPFVNERIVEDGAAKFLTPPTKSVARPTKQDEKLQNLENFYTDRFHKAQVRSEMAQRGLWGACPATGD